MDAALRDQFRAGFYTSRLAKWIDDPFDDTEAVSPDVAGCLAAIESGRRDFSYPGHDAAVFKLLQQIVPERGLRRGADIGCETGAFPAMQIAAGVESCTIFEVRQTAANHERVEVRVQNLTDAKDVQPEFDLITCLSTIEHIGLGRYGDPIDPWGDVKMAANLRQLLRPGGILLMSFPTGPGRVVFNKNRIYTSYRRATLFGDLVQLQKVPDVSLVQRLRNRVGALVTRASYASQPIYVLVKPASPRAGSRSLASIR